MRAWKWCCRYNSMKDGSVLDATDQLEQDNPLAVTMGIYPTLSVPEMMLYLKGPVVIAKWRPIESE